MVTVDTSRDTGRFAGLIKEVIGGNHQAVMEALTKCGALDWDAFALFHKANFETLSEFGSISTIDKKKLQFLLGLCHWEIMNGNQNVPTIEMFNKYQQSQLMAWIKKEDPHCAPPTKAPPTKAPPRKKQRGNGLPKDPIPYTRTYAHTISQEKSKMYISLLKQKRIFPNMWFSSKWLSPTTNLLQSMDGTGKELVIVYNMFFGSVTINENREGKIKEILQKAKDYQGLGLLATLSRFNSECCEDRLEVKNITFMGWGCCCLTPTVESCCLVVLDLFFHHVDWEKNEGRGDGHRKTLFLEPRSGLVFPNKDGLLWLYGKRVREDSDVYTQNMPPADLTTKEGITEWISNNEEKTEKKKKAEVKIQSCFTRFFYPMRNRKGEQTQYEREIDINSVVVLSTLPGRNDDETESEHE